MSYVNNFGKFRLRLKKPHEPTRRLCDSVTETFLRDDKINERTQQAMMFRLFTKNINTDAETRSATAHRKAKGCGNIYDISGINLYQGEVA